MSYEDAGNYNGFGGTQVGAGGGHFASPSQGTMNQYGNGGSGGAPTKKRDPQSITRVTVKQLNEATEQGGKFFIDGKPINQIEAPLNILTIDQKETHIELTVEDGTGTIAARMYIDRSENNPLIANLKDQEYRHFVGQLKRIGSGLCIVAFSIAPIEDHNIITAHLLDVILAHQRNTGAVKKSEGGAGMKAESNGAVGMQVDHVGGGGGYQPLGGMGMGGDCKSQVLHVFAHGNGSETDDGCSIQTVCAQLRTFTWDQIHTAVQELANEGHLYSTIDEDHFKTTATS